MACAITKGRTLPCKNSVGGLKNVYILDYSTTISGLSPVLGLITLPTDDTAEFLNLRLKEILV